MSVETSSHLRGKVKTFSCCCVVLDLQIEKFPLSNCQSYTFHVQKIWYYMYKDKSWPEDKTRQIKMQMRY